MNSNNLIDEKPPRQWISPAARQERKDIIIEFRRDGYMYTDIAEFFGITKYNVSSIMRGTADPLDALVFIDRGGNVRVSKGGKFTGTHGRRFKPEYYSWYSMKTRCGNPNHADYPNWGGRGITYDPAWERFDDFYADMGPRPTTGKYSLERLDNSKGYSKDNCVWLLTSHQTRNQRNTKLSMEKARDIRRLYANGGGVSYQGIADFYGVADSLIAGIIKGRVWKEAA